MRVYINQIFTTLRLLWILHNINWHKCFSVAYTQEKRRISSFFHVYVYSPMLLYFSSFFRQMKRGNGREGKNGVEVVVVEMKKISYFQYIESNTTDCCRFEERRCYCSLSLSLYLSPPRRDYKCLNWLNISELRINEAK